ncbi:MAG: hypothetical protein A2X86_21325 [Bdellovibrionales bacterium GWA2_49_15]|nr:MAG: hypothetical protein A2X86_21325 [Bdellovibrionales bacterium GWA2_49_15]HAZ14921.1 hypothetical protein [Bdellovibrionales bacterium]
MQLSNDPLLLKLKEALANVRAKKSDIFNGWEVSISDSRSMQSLMMSDPIQGLASYQDREVLDRAYGIEVFTQSGEPKVMGNSTCNIDPLAPLEEQIVKTLQNALQVSNRPWNLPTPEKEAPEAVLIADPEIKADIKAAHAKLLGQASAKAKRIDIVKLNSAELYTNIRSTYFETSTGLKGQQDRTDLYFEVALEKLPLPNTQEVLKMKTAISIEEASLPAFIDEIVTETLSIDQAGLPKTQSNAVILIDGKTISDLLKNLLGQFYAHNEYNKLPFLLPGQKTYSGEKAIDSDKLGLTLDPTLPVMAASSAFTGEGLTAKKGVMIENDTVMHQIVSNRMGQYLGKKTNTMAGNIVVPPGHYSKDELLKSVPECLEIISFSSLLINPSTLTWSSEIKLAKHYQKGELAGMIKGGVVSGDIKENLRNFKFSSKEKKINEVGNSFASPKGYIGPDAMLIKSGVKIAGE